MRREDDAGVQLWQLHKVLKEGTGVREVVLLHNGRICDKTRAPCHSWVFSGLSCALQQKEHPWID